MTFKTLFKLNLLFLFAIVLSCSKDDSGGEKTISFDANAQIHVEEINATTAKFELLSGSKDNLKIRVRRKNTTDYTFIEIGTSYNQLKPGSIYEAQLFVDTTEEDISQYETVNFTTPLLDFIKEVNSENSSQHIKSIPGFEHEIELGTLDENYSDIFNSDFTLELINTLDENIKRNIEYTINGNVLEFVMPIDILDNTVSNLDNYNLSYNLNGTSYFFTNSIIDSKYTITVFQPEPSFSSVGLITRKNCDNVHAWQITFLGYFFNSLEGSGFAEVLYDNVNLIITNLDDDTELLINNESTSSLECNSFSRFWSPDSVVTDGGLLQIHSNVILTLNYTETLDGPFIFTTGNYKIKANFSNDEGDFKTTEEFEFTIQ